MKNIFASLLALASTALITAPASATEPRDTYQLNKACVAKVRAMNELLGSSFKTPKLNPNATVEVTVDERPETLEDMGFTKVHALVKVISNAADDAAFDLDPHTTEITTVANALDLGDDCYIAGINAEIKE